MTESRKRQPKRAGRAKKTRKKRVLQKKRNAESRRGRAGPVTPHKKKPAPEVPDERVLKRHLFSAAADVEKKDVRRLVQNREQFDDKLQDVPGRLRKFVLQLRLLFELVQDWWSGEYKKVPWLTIALAAAAILYFINPFDLVPDVIPVVGYLDDAAVVALAVVALQEDLKEYCRFKGYRLRDYF